MKDFFHALPDDEVKALKKPNGKSWLRTDELAYKLGIRDNLTRPVSAFILDVKDDKALVVVMRQDRVASSATWEFWHPIDDL